MQDTRHVFLGSLLMIMCFGGSVCGADPLAADPTAADPLGADPLGAAPTGADGSSTAASSTEPAGEVAPKKKLRSKILRLDKTQPWLRANGFAVTTAGGAPTIRMRFYNSHKNRPAEGVNALGKGTARDDHGHEYNAFTPSMVSTLGPQKAYKAEYRLIPKLNPKSEALLLLLYPLEARVLYVQLRREDGNWEIEEYGTWKEERAYFNQSEWAEDLVRLNPYKKAAAEVRIWRDDSGEFSVRASFVEFKMDRESRESIVSLKREDNSKIIEIPHQRLSSADHKYIRELKQKRYDEKKEERERKKKQHEKIKNLRNPKKARKEARKLRFDPSDQSRSLFPRSREESSSRYNELIIKPRFSIIAFSAPDLTRVERAS